MLKEKDFQKMLMQFFKENKVEALAEYIPPNINITTKDRIDIYLPAKNIIIEIKEARKFKDAIGQVKTYRHYLQMAGCHNSKMAICLFGHTTQSQSDTIRRLCNEESIQLLYMRVNVTLEDVSNNKTLWKC